MFTTISALLAELAHCALRAGVALRASGGETAVGAVTCGATVAPSWVFAAGADCGGSPAAAIGLADVTSKPSSRARLAAAGSCTSERLARRMSVAGLFGVFLMIKRPLGEFSQHPAPQLPDLLRGSSRLRKLGDAQACPERVLMIIALSNIRKRKHAERIE